MKWPSGNNPRSGTNQTKRWFLNRDHSPKNEQICNRSHPSYDRSDKLHPLEHRRRSCPKWLLSHTHWHRSSSRPVQLLHQQNKPPKKWLSSIWSDNYSKGIWCYQRIWLTCGLIQQDNCSYQGSIDRSIREKNHQAPPTMTTPKATTTSRSLGKYALQHPGEMTIVFKP